MIALLAVVSITAQTTAIVNPLEKADEAELRRQSFEKVWSTINEKHYDPTFGGVDWKKMREIYEPKAAAAKDLNGFYAVLRQMLDELKLSHFGIFPRNAQIQTAEFGGAITGIGLKMIDGKFVVNRLEAGSSAEKAGIKKGFIVTKIDGKSISDILAPLEKVLAERKEGEKTKQIYRESVAASYLDGNPGTVVKIEVLDAKDQPQVFSVARYVAEYELSEALGNFPSQKVIFESKRLDGNIGYIRFNIWVVPQMPKIREAIREFSDAKGIIFDLRGNPGGVGGMAPGIAGFLSKEKVSLGSMNGRASQTNFIAYPQSNPFLGKIVILTDHGSGSTSEVFAAGLQEIGRAKIIGETSAGAVLLSVFDTLPTGAIFQYPISDYKSPKNVLIEGRGVVPDTEVKTTRKSLLEGRDLQIEEAVKQILN
ncbi:MAG: S41 family peptidase [Pyrinomonadaceae bacterium]|nr:S41 family peptidase [Pyrinomonadaceae bacterium]